jgi:hypothetical protein
MTLAAEILMWSMIGLGAVWLLLFGLFMWIGFMEDPKYAQKRRDRGRPF